MSAIDDLFAQLKSEGKKAFMPFITAGDPDVEFSSALLQSLDQAGCHLAELGIPYSDPIACLLYTSPSPRDKRQSRMPSSA